jgi:hypothetical protein
VQHASRIDSVNLDGCRINLAGIRISSERCVIAAVADPIELRGSNRHTTQHRTPLIHAGTRRLWLRKAFKNLNPDFLREWTFDLAHAIPEPDDFALLLDIHWSPPKMINENITGTTLQAANGENAEATTARFSVLEAEAENFQPTGFSCARFRLRSVCLL